MSKPLPFHTMMTALMIIAVVNMIAGNFYFQREFLEPLRERTASVTPAYFADDQTAFGIGDHKPPRSSYTNYDFLFSSFDLLKTAVHSNSFLYPDETPATLEEVFMDVLVPPKISLNPVTTFWA